MGIGYHIRALRFVAQKSFSLPESVLDNSKARFRRLQNSPAAQTVVIAYLPLRQDLFAKKLLTAAQRILFGQHPLRYENVLYIKQQSAFSDLYRLNNHCYVIMVTNYG